METFYEMAVKLIGNLPPTATWIYTLATILLVASIFMIFIIPFALVLRRVGR